MIPEEKIDDLSIKLKAFKKLADSSAPNEPSANKDDVGELNFEYGLHRSSAVKNKYSISAKMRPKRVKELTAAIASKYLKEPNGFFNILNDLGVREIVGTSCTTFTFPSINYSTAGGMSLPTKIELTKEIKEKIGEVEIGGFTLHFVESPIGVRDVILRLEMNNLVTSIVVDYKLTSLDKMFERSFDITKEVLDLIVVKKK